VLRSLPSLPLRYAEQDRNGRAFAHWCLSQRAFARVMHPALAGSPGHAHWASHCRAAAGLVCVEFDPQFAQVQVDAFVDALRRFRIGWSWGGPVSLAVPYQASAIRSRQTPYLGSLVRFCIGLEAVQDLIADAEQALGALGR
jgi:cystathionine beta-lyase